MRGQLRVAGLRRGLVLVVGDVLAPVDRDIRSTRPGGPVGYVGVFHDAELPVSELFFSGIHLHGGPAPVRRFLPEFIDLIWNRQIDPGKVFDLELPLDQAAAGYEAMDTRRAIKVLLRT